MATENGKTQAIEKTSPQSVEVSERTPAQQERTGWVFTPAVDIWDTGQEWVMTADVPGADPQKIEVTCEDNVLTVHAPVAQRWHGPATVRRAEYNIGDYRRTFRIGDDIDVEKIHAECAAGVLTVHLPKSSRAQTRRIPINVA